MKLFLSNLFLMQANPPGVPNVGWLDIIWLLVQTAIALALVCGFAILIFRYILPRLNVASFNNKSIVNVVDAAPLEARKRLIVVEAAGKYMLLAVSESGVQFISELDGNAVERAIGDTQKLQQENKNDAFTQVLDRLRRK